MPHQAFAISSAQAFIKSSCQARATVDPYVEAYQAVNLAVLQDNADSSVAFVNAYNSTAAYFGGSPGWRSSAAWLSWQRVANEYYWLPPVHRWTLSPDLICLRPCYRSIISKLEVRYREWTNNTAVPENFHILYKLDAAAPASIDDIRGWDILQTMQTGVGTYDTYGFMDVTDIFKASDEFFWLAVMPESYLDYPPIEPACWSYDAPVGVDRTAEFDLLPFAQAYVKINNVQQDAVGISQPPAVG